MFDIKLQWLNLTYYQIPTSILTDICVRTFLLLTIICQPKVYSKHKACLGSKQIPRAFHERKTALIFLQIICHTATMERY